MSLVWQYPVTPKYTPPGGEFGSTTLDNGKPRKVPHSGIDWARNAGEKVVAAAAGNVIAVGSSPDGWGNYVWIAHGRDTITRRRVMTGYAHLRDRVRLAVGDRVQAGTVLGVVGASGAVTGAHLHFVVAIGGTPTQVFALDRRFLVDPARFLRIRIEAQQAATVAEITPPVVPDVVEVVIKPPVVPKEEPMTTPPKITPPTGATTPPAAPDVILPRRVRGPLLLCTWIVGSGLGALNVGWIYAVAQDAATYPLWLGIATAVYGFVAGQVAAIARANLTPPA